MGLPGAEGFWVEDLQAKALVAFVRQPSTKPSAPGRPIPGPESSPAALAALTATPCSGLSYPALLRLFQ